MSYKDKRQLTIHTEFPQLSTPNTMQTVNGSVAAKVPKNNGSFSTKVPNNNGSFSTKLPYANSMRTVFRGSLPDDTLMPTRPDHFFQPQTPPSATAQCCCTCCKGTQKQSAKTVMC